MGISIKKHDQHPESILIRDLQGKLGFDEIMRSWEDLLASHLITPELKGIINDLSGCELDLDLKSFGVLTEYLKKHDKLKALRIATISTSPNTIVYPMLGDLKLKEFEIQPFSTMEAATSWILR